MNVVHFEVLLSDLASVGKKFMLAVEVAFWCLAKENVFALLRAVDDISHMTPDCLYNTFDLSTSRLS